MAGKFEDLVSRQRLPPSLNSGNMVRQEPSMMEAIGGEENIGSGAGALPQSKIFDVIDRLLRQRQQLDRGLPPGPGSSLTGPMQLAGDLLTPYAAGTARGDEALRRRLETPGFWQGSRGAGSVNFYGGPRRNPTLDLLEVLQFPSGTPFPTRAYGGPVNPNEPYVVGEGGPEKFVPIRTAQADFPPLPEGAKPVTPGTPSEEWPALPEGARLLTPAEESQRARENAAYRTRMGTKPVGGRVEGSLSEVPGKVVGAMDEAARQAFEASRRMAEGDPTVSAKPTFDAAMMAAGGPPGLAGAARTALPRALTPEQAAQIATGVTSIPRAAEAGPIGSAIASRFGRTPEMAGRASSELRSAAEALSADQAQAGAYLRDAINTAGERVHPRLTVLTKSSRSDENVLDTLYGMARTGSRDDLAAMAQLRKIVPVEQQSAVQGALVQRLGQGTEGFDPSGFVSRYSGLSDRAKNVLFSPELRRQLDSIESVSRRAPTWQRFEGEVIGGPGAVTGAAMAGGTALLGPIAGPLAGLAAVVPLDIIGRALARPATAASVAAWSRAYERVMRTNKAPQAMGAFSLATRNLNNNLGTDITPDDVLRGQ